MTIEQQRSMMFSSVDYDPQRRILSLTFRRGNRSYDYQDVPPEVYEELMRSGSMGSYYLSHIKDVYA